MKRALAAVLLSVLVLPSCANGMSFNQQAAATVALIDPATKRVRCSGVIVADDVVLTANHCVNPVADDVYVRFIDGREAKGTVLKRGGNVDVASIAVETEELMPAYVQKNSQQGDAVCAVGHPLGLTWTLTCGILSAYREILPDDESFGTAAGLFWQTDAALNGGNSGGGLFAVNGGLVGIVSWKAIGNNVDGLNFAVPIAIALEVLGL